MRQFVLSTCLVIVILICSPVFSNSVFSKTISMDEKKVSYNLPYPGLLSDHPLYSIKKLRDSVLVFSTRDKLKKAELYLQLSDKHTSAAIQLAQKGKEQHSINELKRSEKYFDMIPQLLKDSKEQGAAPTNDFIITLYLSNSKHEEVITDIMKNTTQGNIEEYNKLLNTNKEIRKKIGEI